MPNALTLVQTSPASNPDKNTVSCAVTGAYTSGTPDPLPLAAIADPQELVQVPMNTTPPVTPRWFGFCAGYYAQVQRSVSAGVTSFGLRWFAAEGSELASANFPAAILNGESFIEILCQTTQQ
jgi:hypothetical protein